MWASYAFAANSQAATNNSLSLTPDDPETFYIREQLAARAGNTDRAIEECLRSLRLRPNDYFLWLELGQLQEQKNNPGGAIQAYLQAKTLAPSYSPPRWRIGNMLLRTGQPDAAFSDLNVAAMADNRLFPAVLDLAFTVANGDSELLRKYVKPSGNNEEFAFSRAFARRGMGAEALEVFRGIEPKDSEQTATLVKDLVDAGQVRDAFTVWSTGREIPGDGLVNGDFEDALAPEPNTFGWKVNRSDSVVTASISSTTHNSGSYSLEIYWAGDLDPDHPAVSQLIPVASSTTYTLMLKAKAEHLVSYAYPVISVRRWGTATAGAELVPSVHINSRNDEWTTTRIEFTTDQSTQGVVLGFGKSKCTVTPCPIFGKLWIDNALLIKNG